jgi:SAM-dependent methyltransferase
MHPSVMAFAQRQITKAHVHQALVLEVGAQNINGSLRPYIESLGPAVYLGVDIADGPGVDLVVDCEQLSATIDTGWDLVICTEVLEHVPNWRICMHELVAVMAPGGYLLLTTRSPGFPYHGFPGDYWRFTRTDMGEIVYGLGLDPLTLDDDDPQTPGVLLFARKPQRKPKDRTTHWPNLVIATP